ncbi:hypothetical protein [Streptomyces murinus]|uniref:hypothetical protein n=1 Tax=Streptomyces murinus TaxID=33900 RepID=UPI0018F4399E|nr:hypothetical protein [Streptomyces murinus]
MKNPEPTSSHPPLSFELRSDHLAGYLRVDQIRTDTLTQLVAGWADPDTRDDVIEALDSLAAVVQGIRREGELDAAIEEIEGVASMETARVEFKAPAGGRLLRELDVVAHTLGRFNLAAITTPRSVTTQQDRRAS